MNKYQPEPRIRKLKSILKGGDHKKSWQYKLQLQNEFTLSLIFVLFSVSLSLSAVSFANMSQKNMHAEIGKYYSDKAGEHLWYIYSIVYILIAQDTFILLAMIIGVLCSIGFCFFLDLTETSSVEQSVKNLEALADTFKRSLDAKYKPTLGTEVEHLVAAALTLKEELRHIIKPARQERDRILETVVLFKNNRIQSLNETIRELDSIVQTLERMKYQTEAIKNGADLSTIRQEQKSDLLTKLENLLGSGEWVQQQINLMKEIRDALEQICDNSHRHLTADLTNIVEVISQGIYTDYFSRCNKDWRTVIDDVSNLKLCADPGMLHKSVKDLIARIADLSLVRGDFTNCIKAMSDAGAAIKGWIHVHQNRIPVGNNLCSARLSLGAVEFVFSHNDLCY